MATAVAKEAPHVVTVKIPAVQEELLRAVANELCGGSRSKAVGLLVDRHAGKVIAEAREANAEWETEKWSKRRLSFELAQTVARLRRAGNTRSDSFTLAGVSANQARRWLAQGRSDINAGKSSGYADFAFGLDLAEAELKREELEKARAAGDYKFVLSRQFTDDYAERKRTDTSVTHRFNLVIDWEALTLAEARTLVALLRKGSPGADGPALGRHDRPALEAVPPEIMAATIEDADWSEVEENDDAPAELTSGQVQEQPVGERGSDHGDEKDRPEGEGGHAR